MDAGDAVGGAEAAGLKRVDAHDLIARQAEGNCLARVAQLELRLGDALRLEAVLGPGGGEKIVKARQRLRRLLFLLLRVLCLIGRPALGESSRKLGTVVLR